MNRIKGLFSRKQKGILSVYFCAGHPAAGMVGDTICALAEEGVDMIEVGIPFSDPLADGPVIQNASTIALRNGVSVRRLFQELEGIRDRVEIPLILMGYINPILRYGFEDFCCRSHEVGIDGLIIPDLPFDEFARDYRPIAQKHGLECVFLVTPETEEERIRTIDEASNGFIYAVSSAAVTGAQKSFNAAKQAYFTRLEQMHLRNPFLVGFGISNKETREAAEAHSAGVIVGSKYITLIAETGDPKQAAVRLREALQL